MSLGEYESAMRAVLPVWAGDAVKERVLGRLKK
mgnify:CR=1 FL=1